MTTLGPVLGPADMTGAVFLLVTIAWVRFFATLALLSHIRSHKG